MLKDITHYNGEFKYPVVKIDAGRERADHEPAPSPGRVETSPHYSGGEPVTLLRAQHERSL